MNQEAEEIGEKIIRGELVVMTNLNHEIIVCTPEQAKDIQAKQAAEIFNNAFSTE